MAVQMGTFGSFTTARLAIYASQASLNVTGNNIANINTKGYTRQRMDLVSLYPTGEARYSNNYNLSIGYGVLCDSVSQLRDPFLDIRYRNENTNVGAYEAKLNGLTQLGHILDEVGKGDQGFGVIEDQLGDFVEMLQNWNNQTNIEEYDNLVRASASQLCTLFNAAAKDLQEVYTNQEKYLEDNMSKVNSLLTQIRDLNEQIRSHNIYGDNALELKDARNVAIDELSSLMKISVTYSMEKVDQFTEVEKLTITLPGTTDPGLDKYAAQDAADAYNQAHQTDPDFVAKTWQDFATSNFDNAIKLIDGIYGTQISIDRTYTENPEYDPNAKQYLEVDPVTNQPVRDPITGEYKETDDPSNWINPKYGQYLDANGIPTNDIEKADFEYDPYYLMTLDPLVDKRGKYMRDPEYGNQLKQSVPLKDTDLYGAIQSMRELLTEEGEFASYKEMGIDLDPTDPDYEYQLRVADPKADTKRGIPYYMKALDNLAQQFARELNKLNQPDQYGVGIDADNQPVWGPELTLDMVYQTYAPAKGENPQYDLMYKVENGVFVDSTGTSLGFGPDDVKYANLQPDATDGNYYDPDDPTIQIPAATVTQHQANLNALQAAGTGGVPIKTFIKADGTPVLNTDKENMTYDDVKYAGLDPLTLHEDFTDLETQQEAIRKAQENLELLRDADNRTDEWNFYRGGALFSNSNNNNDPTNITAANISVSQDWSTGAVRVLHSVQPNEVTFDANGNKTVHTHSTAGDNVTHIISSLQGKRDFYATDIDADSSATRFYFRGSFQEFFTNLSSTLGVETNETTALYNHYDLEALQLDNDRQSVSGVDLNEEATSMMQFQKSFSAACQLLTIIDSMLDKLINGTI